MTTREDRQHRLNAFHEAMADIYLRAKKEAHYTAGYFLSMVADRGGYDTALFLVRRDTPSDGYTALYERGRLDLTVEALIIRREWADLFSEGDRLLAKQRLKDYGFDVDGYIEKWA